MTKNTRQMLMKDKEITPDIFLECKDMRDKCIDRIELLDKVKQIFLLPELECLTTKQLADYFEVGVEAIQTQYKRNKIEFNEDGVSLKKISDFKSRCCSGRTTLKMVQRKGFVELTDKNGITISIPYCGIKCFPKRAILRMGMLLQDSRVAKEIRTQLLNVFEHTTSEQKIAELTKEEGYITDIVTNLLHNNPDKVLVSLTDYHNYITRKITAIQENNKQLSDKIESDKPLVEFANQVKEADNAITIDEMCRLMHDGNMNMGRIRFYKWLRMKGYLMKNNLPYQKYINNGYFKVAEYLYSTAYDIRTATKTMITGKGQVAIMEVLRKEYSKMRK